MKHFLIFCTVLYVVFGAAVARSQPSGGGASVPPACSQLFPVATPAGSVGSLSPCIPPSDATPITVVQKARVTTGSTGTWAITWATPFTSSTPVVNAIPINSGSEPVICNTTASTATAASGQCWTLTTTVLSLAIVTAGLTLNPSGNSAAGITVQLIGGNPTQ